MTSTRPIAICDTECDAHWWLIKFRLPDGRMFSYDICAESPQPLHYAAVQWFIDNYTLGTFNGENYDIPMIELAMSGASVHALKQLNDMIITGGLKRWELPDRQPLRNLDHIDIMEVAPGVRVGLKAYMGRMHAPKLQDLPFDPSKPMPVEMRAVTDDYCGNDLAGTHMLFEACRERLALREEIGAEYGIDVRSKSDAQIAEAIFRARLGFKPERRTVPHGYQFQHQPAHYLRFVTPVMQSAFETVKRAVFTINDIDQVKAATGLQGEEIVGPDGKKLKTGLIMPPEIKALRITVGRSTYQLGVGGLHSTESSVTYRTVPGVCRLVAPDVRSYYPSLILQSGQYPQQIGPDFLAIYRHEYDSRLAAKDALRGMKKGTPEYLKTKTTEGVKKLLLNGSFGKLFSKYSMLFAPELGLWVTLTGQLSLLMLIEQLELAGISVVSANTDGLELLVPERLQWVCDVIIARWERITGLGMDSEVYQLIAHRDVNSYVGITASGEVKSKGAYADSGVLNNVNPEKDICKRAVVAYLKDGTPLADTIRACRDIRQFLIIRSAKGGGVWRGKYLGKTVRWYYAVGSDGPIQYATNGNKVAGSDGCRPAMTLPEAFPDDVDYGRYIAAAQDMLRDVGVAAP